MKGAKHKKSLEGRVLEIASAAKIGKGEFTIRKEEHNKAPKHIREGIKAKRKERAQKQLEEVCWYDRVVRFRSDIGSRLKIWATTIPL